MTWLWLTIGALAAYRVGLMVSEEAGPFAIFTRLRNRWTDDEDWKATGIRCLRCVSFWAALAVAGGLVALGRATLFELPLLWLALAGAAILIDKYWKRS